MKSVLVASLVLGAALAAPQLQQFKDLLSGLVGEDKAEKVGEKDYEGVPYSVIQEYEVGILKRKLYVYYLVLGL